MKIKQTVYSKTEPPKDRDILGRFKPNSWPHIVRWGDGVWCVVGMDKTYVEGDLIDWSEV